MKFMVTWIFEPENMNEIRARFMENGGMPPEGVTMIGRWFDVGAGRGFAAVDSDNSVAMGKWVRGWSDLMSFEVIPVHDDTDIGQVLAD